jgi:hypothetical protein
LYSLDFPRIALWSGYLDPHSAEPSASIALAALRALSQLDADVQVEVLEYIGQLARENRDKQG